MSSVQSGLNTVDLALLRRRPETCVWKLEASLVCEHCRGETGQRAQAYIIGLAETKLREPEPRAAKRWREITPMMPPNLIHHGGAAIGRLPMPDDRRSFRGLIGAILVAAVLSVIFSTIAVYALNRYLGPVDAGDTTA